jgi:hypothetical protein
MVKVALFIGALLGLSNALRVEEHEIAVQISHSKVLFIFRGWSLLPMSRRYTTMAVY